MFLFFSQLSVCRSPVIDKKVQARDALSIVFTLRENATVDKTTRKAQDNNGKRNDAKFEMYNVFWIGRHRRLRAEKPAKKRTLLIDAAVKRNIERIVFCQLCFDFLCWAVAREPQHFVVAQHVGRRAPRVRIVYRAVQGQRVSPYGNRFRAGAVGHVVDRIVCINALDIAAANWKPCVLRKSCRRWRRGQLIVPFFGFLQVSIRVDDADNADGNED